MVISINHEQGTNPVIQNTVQAALERHIKTTLVFAMVRFEVSTFNEFLSCLWHGFSEASKVSQGWAIHKSYEVIVHHDNGVYYHCFVRLDDDYKGLRYGCLREFDNK